jgi:hypothetical protein
MQIIQHANVGQVPRQTPDGGFGKDNPVVVVLGHVDQYMDAINLQNYLNFSNTKQFTPYFKEIGPIFNICYDEISRAQPFG